MNTTPPNNDDADDDAAAEAAAGRLGVALATALPSERLHAAMAAGTHPRPEYVGVLLDAAPSNPISTFARHSRGR
ncbi:hypothetical protein [Salinibacterium sp. PAMC 21357]|uniref:hypothetical protein n=1 Tax=Salinibacterium sp. PAMC 21357 TaxID=1112215 RepID=UPI000288B096|nr:hypothetical protein [Salinibacterium sp. PAMC 21357]